ncbi:MAG: hypothetical protein KGH87_09510 [Thaumarchaeota archaeon]|nr:hypothetical protein [Nitrososphaerota archaeon]
MEIINDNRLLGITAGLVFCQKHTIPEIRAELKSLESIHIDNDSLMGKLYAITWALENSDKVADKLEECKTELATRKLGNNDTARSHTEALSI